MANRTEYDPSQAPAQHFEVGQFVLESGEVIQDFVLSYVTHGRLNSERSNAILLTSSISGNAHRLDFLIGHGKAFDPERYFIVGTDAIGNGRTTSPSNSRRQPGLKFPRFTIRDIVRSQEKLLTERLGIGHLLAVAGASMGGMQALEWGVSFPHSMRALIAIVPMAKTPAWSVAVNEASRLALMADSAWNEGNYREQPEKGWRAWVALMQVIAVRTPVALKTRFPCPRDVIDWIVELEMKWLEKGFDANDWIYQTWAYDRHDVGSAAGFGGDTARALASIRARALILAPPLDLYNPAEEALETARLIPDARFVEIPSCQGHSAGNPSERADIDFINQAIKEFLEPISGG